MGEIILNGKSYNSGMKYKEVTQAEYNALPSSKLTDGTLYCITDAPGPGEGFPPLIYSTEEREVGVWKDGKPLYQKTVTLDSFVYGSFQEDAKSVSIDNIETLVDWYGFATKNGYAFPLNGNVGLVLSVDGWKIASWAHSATNSVKFSYFMGNSYSPSVWIITLKYTKTTDAPGSSKWNAQGTFNSIDVTEHVKVASGITLNSGFSYKAVKTGNVVTLSASGSIDSGAAAIGTNYNLFTVDDVIAPIANGTMYCFGAGSSNARVAASTSKNISITGGGWCSFTVNWISK